MTIPQLSDFFQVHDNFLLMSHESPDADALGSEIALYHGLRQLGKQAMIANYDIADAKYNFFNDIDLVKNISDKQTQNEVLASRRQFIILDTLPDHIGNVDPEILSFLPLPHIIDHHDSFIDETLYQGYFDPDASSTCEIIAILLKEMNVSFNYDIALPLFTGIVYDTGSFIYPKTGCRTFAIARDLMEYGVKPNRVYQQLYQNKSANAVKLQALVLQTLEFELENRVAVLTLEPEMLQITGASLSEAHEMVDIPLQSRDVELSFFIRMDSNKNSGKCSLRSKGNIDCLEIAESIGGGGHKTASGFRFSGSESDIKGKVLEIIKKSIP